MEDPYATAAPATPDEVLEKKRSNISCFIVIECHLLFAKCVISMAKKDYTDNNEGYNGVSEVMQR